VKIAGSDEEFPVAERGEVYVTGLAEKSRLRASWRGQSCEFGIELDKQSELVPRLGPLRCAGVRR
jgi:outer membrane usher protein